MADQNRKFLTEGHVPLKKGWVPTVQGGYKPAQTTMTTAAPPTGGSAVKPPPVAKSK